MRTDIKSLRIIALAVACVLISTVSAEAAYFSVSHEYTLTDPGGVDVDAFFTRYKGYASAKQNYTAEKKKEVNRAVLFQNIIGSVSESASVDAGDSNANINFQTGVTRVQNGIKLNQIVFGTADARLTTSPPGRASSSGSIFSTMSGSIRKGKIRVNPWMTAQGSVMQQKDPIEYTVVDTVTGDTVSGTLFDVSFNSDGAGTVFSWEEGTLSLSALEGNTDFSIMIADDPYLSGSGVFSFSTVDGIITDFAATGLFAAYDILTVGATALFDLTLPTLFDLDFDFSDFTLNEISTKFLFSSGSGATESVNVVPEPSSFLLLGLSLLVIFPYLRWKSVRR